jgi:hypothetical protein
MKSFLVFTNLDANAYIMLNRPAQPSQTQLILATNNDHSEVSNP